MRHLHHSYPRCLINEVYGERRGLQSVIKNGLVISELNSLFLDLMCFLIRIFAL